MAADEKRKLLQFLAKYAYAYRPEGIRLASGNVSTEYLDCRAALSHPEALQAAGLAVLAELDPRAVALGGLTMGADPIAVGASLASGRVSWFSVRKEPKKHGTKKLIEGDVPAGASVTVVDDVVTTGGSTVEAIQKCREAGLVVVQVIVLVDREESEGLARVRQEAGASLPVVALLTKTQVAAEWKEQQALRTAG